MNTLTKYRLCTGAIATLAAGLILSGCGQKEGVHTDGGAKPAGKVTSIQNIGSDTMVNLAQAWAETYHQVDPSVSVEVSGGGSGIGVAALINGTCEIANSSRALEPEEIQKAKSKHGHDPKEFLVGWDALAIYVHSSNPIDEISIEELSEIYKEGGTIDKWSQLGSKLAGGEEIIRISRQNNSGTYHYFREMVVGKKSDFKLGSKDMNGSKDVVELVSRTPNAIGYSGLGYRTDKVKVLKVSKRRVAPTSHRASRPPGTRATPLLARCSCTRPDNPHRTFRSISTGYSPTLAKSS